MRDRDGDTLHPIWGFSGTGFSGIGRLFGLAAAGLLAVGCVTSLEVAFDEREDLSPYRTWSWAPVGDERVQAPGADPALLEVRVRRSIEAQLAAKGFTRTNRGADFVVDYRLALARRSVLEQQARGTYQLSSHSYSPSYEIGGSEVVTRVYQAIHLAIEASPARRAPAWRAELRQSAEDEFSLSPEEAVARLLEHFPEQDPRPACRAGSPTPDELAPHDEVDRRCTPPRPPAPAPRTPRRPDVAIGQLG